ncbi:signal peptidase I [Streptococcus halotolerans]|uniref:signal peptidase I n=1 Tax=Streptococcus halotolerans TaxID=1814128 RepID=UPI00078896E6|nr:signal peptidase I [Streptococcus halotolerans]
MVKRDLIRNIILAIILTLVLFFIGRFYISTIKISEKNENNFLKANDVLVYNKQEKPKPDDFVVYVIDGKKYISRVIAEGGDTVTSMDDVLYINGLVKPEPYIENLKAAYLAQTNHQVNFTKDFNLQTITKSSKDKIGKGHFLVLNDNRRDEQDSRQFGLIDQSQIKGVLTFKLYPFDAFGFLENQ